MAKGNDELCRHRRKEWPSPSKDIWKVGCSCGWLSHVALNVMAGLTTAQIKQELEKLFIAHVPTDQRRVYVRVDRTPGREGQWLMPEGEPCVITSWYGDIQNGYFVNVGEPIVATLPVGEVFTEDGRVFRQE